MDNKSKSVDFQRTITASTIVVVIMRYCGMKKIQQIQFWSMVLKIFWQIYSNWHWFMTWTMVVRFSRYVCLFAYECLVNCVSHKNHCGELRKWADINGSLVCGVPWFLLWLLAVGQESSIELRQQTTHRVLKFAV